MGIKLERHLCVVAPVFGLSDSAGYARASTEFLERVRKLDYPQFLFLPKGGPLIMDSLLRLDEIQSVVVQNLAHTGYLLAPEALSVFRSQVGFYMGGNAGGEFQDYVTCSHPNEGFLRWSHLASPSHLARVVRGKIQSNYLRV